ncbi:hypothetical protein RUM44_000137 [Polyplax serrata]|uniref:Uncharacterized protein n=1 Tax=Polyplax serrata TaxID=468196 RepID=A0ABR1B5C1_POLSC
MSETSQRLSEVDDYKSGDDKEEDLQNEDEEGEETKYRRICSKGLPSIFDIEESNRTSFGHALSPISSIRFGSEITQKNSEKSKDTKRRTTATTTTTTRIVKTGKTKKAEIDFCQGFEKFVSKIEEEAAGKILEMIPEKGILETAIESLRSLEISRRRNHFQTGRKQSCFLPKSAAYQQKEPKQFVDFLFGRTPASEEVALDLPKDDFLTGYELIVRNSQPPLGNQFKIEDKSPVMREPMIPADASEDANLLAGFLDLSPANYRIDILPDMTTMDFQTFHLDNESQFLSSSTSTSDAGETCFERETIISIKMRYINCKKGTTARAQVKQLD